MGGNSRYWDLYFTHHGESSSYLTPPAGTYYHTTSTISKIMLQN